MLTDTTFWIDLNLERTRRQPGPVSRFIAEHRAHDLHVSTITWGELAEGAAHVAELEDVLRRIHVFPLPLQAAWTASRIQRDLGARGLRLGENDAWIAGTALTWGQRLVTRDKRFRSVSRLNVVAY